MGNFFFLAAALSLVFGIISGNISAVSAAALEESTHAVELSIKLLGSLCFWSGIMEVARRSGLVNALCEALRPILGLIFPGLKNETKALGAISMNVSANLLGLGNAATPLGISAMKELHKISGNSSSATKEMVLFVVMNTASLQLLPTTVATLRLEAGAERPLDILPAVWLVSALSLFIGIAAAKLSFPKGENS
ncbi:MAG: hypothetical protein IJ306_04825 [Oscillospiraceae bacterium]|nr:hypothetical protein [Oscillospiraceae bacterium]